MPLLQAILDQKQRLICFHGYTGLGKTYIVRNMMHYIAERKFFLGGIIILKLDDVDTLDRLLQMMFEKSINYFNLSFDEKMNLKAQLFDENFMVEFLINFFN